MEPVPWCNGDIGSLLSHVTPIDENRSRMGGNAELVPRFPNCAKHIVCDRCPGLGLNRRQSRADRHHQIRFKSPPVPVMEKPAGLVVMGAGLEDFRGHPGFKEGASQGMGSVGPGGDSLGSPRIGRRGSI